MDETAAVLPQSVQSLTNAVGELELLLASGVQSGVGRGTGRGRVDVTRDSRNAAADISDAVRETAIFASATTLLTNAKAALQQ